MIWKSSEYDWPSSFRYGRDLKQDISGDIVDHSTEMQSRKSYTCSVVTPEILCFRIYSTDMFIS